MGPAALAFHVAPIYARRSQQHNAVTRRAAADPDDARVRAGTTGGAARAAAAAGSARARGARPHSSRRNAVYPVSPIIAAARSPSRSPHGCCVWYPTNTQQQQRPSLRSQARSRPLLDHHGGPSPAQQRQAATAPTTRLRRQLQGPPSPPPQCSLTDELFVGPQSPPRPRPLWKVAFFSFSTGLLWVPFYMYVVEEELRREGRGGLGGTLTIAPLFLALSASLFFHQPQAGLCLAAAAVWIAAMQFYLCRRINRLYVEKAQETTNTAANITPPLQPFWALIPGVNILVAARSVHFLSQGYGADKDEDPVAELLPWVAMDHITLGELVSHPAIWIRL